MERPYTHGLSTRLAVATRVTIKIANPQRSSDVEGGRPIVEARSVRAVPFDPDKLVDLFSMIDPRTGEPVLTSEQVEELEH